MCAFGAHNNARFGIECNIIHYAHYPRIIRPNRPKTCKIRQFPWDTTLENEFFFAFTASTAVRACSERLAASLGEIKRRLLGEYKE